MNIEFLRRSRPARLGTASLGVAAVIGLAACSPAASGGGQPGSTRAGAAPTAASPVASTPGTVPTSGTGSRAMAEMAGMTGMAAMPGMEAMPGMAAMPPAQSTPAPSASPAPPVSGGAPASTVPVAGQAQGQVGILNFAFTPNKITIKAGQSVRWTNEDAVAHTVDFSGHISNAMNRGDSYTQTFTKPGTYHYICSIHPFMHGTVVVTA
jgi:plastocyanin